MKILATADLHGFTPVAEWIAETARNQNVDAIVVAGDILGVPDGPATVEEAQRQSGHEIASILGKAQKPVLYIMGNDDLVELAPESGEFHYLHGRRVTLGEFHFVGYQYSLPFMGGVFEKPEDRIAEDMLALEALIDHRTVLVTHSPAWGILDGRFAGSRSILAAIQKKNPLAHIHGHIHRSFGRDGRHFNVAAATRLQAMTVELPSLTHAVLRAEPGSAGLPDLRL